MPGRPSGPVTDLRALLSQAVAFHQAGRLREAEHLYRRVLEINPKQFDGLHLLGLVHFQTGAYLRAMGRIDAALGINPNVAAAHNSRAAVLQQLRQFGEAVTSCDRAIALQPDYAEAFATRAAALVELKRFEEALASCDRAIALRPDLAEAFSNSGNALKELKRPIEALASYDRAIALRADYAGAYCNRANVLNILNRFEQALASCERAIELKPDLAEAHFNRAIALEQIDRHSEALASYDRAVALKPDYAEAWCNRGVTCLALKRYDDALASYGRAMALNPDLDDLKGMHLFARMLVCDWTNFEQDRARLNTAVADGLAASAPFHMLAFSLDPALQLKCANHQFERRRTPLPDPLWRGEIYSHPRIRIAYLSADFRDHPVSYLAIGLFERHDRTRFETTAISSGRDSPSPMRARLKQAFDRFIDAHRQSDEEIAKLMRALEIDIAVDLSGLTDGARAEVLAQRPAPVQINYLGYSGTMGRGYWDYIIADRFVIPEGSEAHYGESVVRLPDCYMANDSRRKISAQLPSRGEAGLPANGFVFCCFNNPYKLTPDMFDVWMRVIGQVSGSVLWLSDVNASAVANLRRRAEIRGVAPDRLVFAPRVALNEDHLARTRLADLFLDTLYYNAHTTAADALWAGVPVLTCAGATFASRVAGSLLHAVGLPELVTGSLAEYEALALKLARDPARLGSLREKLARNRDIYPLFDTERFTRHLEAAYSTMWERAKRGQRPQSFTVACTT